MITRQLSRKTIAYLLVGLTVLVGVIHIWHPITISTPNSGERSGFAVIAFIFSCWIVSGNRSARIGIGLVFLLFSSINLLTILAYVRDISSNSLEIGFWTMALGTLGYSLLFSESIRFFEEERQTQQTANS